MFSCVVSNLKVFEWIKIIALHETIYTDWQSTKRCVNTMAIRNFGFSKSQNEQILLLYSASVSLVTIKNRGGGKGKNLPHPFSTYMYVSILNDFWWFGSFSLYLFSIIQVCVKIIRILTEAETNQCTSKLCVVITPMVHRTYSHAMSDPDLLIITMLPHDWSVTILWLWIYACNREYSPNISCCVIFINFLQGGVLH